MSNSVLIISVAVISVALASPVVLADDLPKIDWMKYANEAAKIIANNKIKPRIQPINWYNYGSGGYVNGYGNDGTNENNGKFGDGTYEKPVHGNNHGNRGNHHNSIINRDDEENNNFPPKPEEEPIDWNKFGNGRNWHKIGHNRGTNNHRPRHHEVLPPIEWDNYGKGDYNDDEFDNHDNNWTVHENVHDNTQGEINFTHCKPSEQYKGTAGMKEWCLNNCFHTPSFCPSSHCHCW